MSDKPQNNTHKFWGSVLYPDKMVVKCEINRNILPDRKTAAIKTLPLR